MGKFIATASAILFAGLVSQASAGDFVSGHDIAVDAEGNPSLPDVDFRSQWTMLGAWSIAGEDGAEGMHVVYTQPGVVEVYRETGEFPDGAVLIKELFSTETGDFSTGRVSFAKDVSGWFMMIRDTQKRFKGNKLWGSGWGWAYFDADDPKHTTTEVYKTECQGCHIPARKTDWVYVQGYPVLKK